MSVYPSDGELYAGWSTGRWCGLAGVAALGLALAGRELIHGWMGPSLVLSEQMIAVFVEYVGGALFCLMTICALGSIGFTRRERGDVEVTAEGVRRIFRPGKVKFVPRAEIAGFVARMGGGVDLLDQRKRRILTVPRSIVGYRDCIAELKSMGILSVTAERASAPEAWKPQTWKERIQLYGAYGVAGLVFSHGTLMEHAVGFAIGAAWIGWIALDHRHDPVRRWLWLQVTMGWAAAGLLILMVVLIRGKW